MEIIVALLTKPMTFFKNKVDYDARAFKDLPNVISCYLLLISLLCSTLSIVYKSSINCFFYLVYSTE